MFDIENYKNKKLIYQGINRLWRIDDFILKQYNNTWINSHEAVLNNIKIGNQFAKICQENGIKVVVGEYEEPFYYKGFYWQLFKNILGKKSSFLSSKNIPSTLAKLQTDYLVKKYKKIDYFKLDRESQKFINRVDKLLSPWYREYNSDLLLMHRDLRPDNLIQSVDGVYIIDFDNVGLKSLQAEQLSMAIDFQQPIENIHLASLAEVIEEWRLWYNHMAYLKQYDILENYLKSLSSTIVPKLKSLIL